MLTLKELKKRVPVAENRGLVMGSVELLHSGAEIVVKETVDTILPDVLTKRRIRLSAAFR